MISVSLGTLASIFGANVGWITMSASCLVKAQGRVHSFEPSPFTLSYLRRRVRCLGLTNVIINEFALGDKPGTAILLTVIVDGVYLIAALRNYLQLSPLVLFRTAYLKPMVLSAVLGMLAFLARPLATPWIGLGALGTGLSLLYIVAGYWIGVFGETEKRALTVLWQIAVRRAP